MKWHITRRPKALIGVHGGLVCVLGMLLCPDAQATEVGTGRPIGIGLALGEPTAVVGKVFTGPNSAWDAGVAFFSTLTRCHDDDKGVRACTGSTNLSINVDYLWIYPLLEAEIKMDLHIGAGGRVWLYTSDAAADNFAVAARVPFGIDFAFDRPEYLEAFIEFAPALAFVPGVYLNLEWAIGARFFF